MHRFYFIFILFFINSYLTRANACPRVLLGWMTMNPYLYISTALSPVLDRDEWLFTLGVLSGRERQQRWSRRVEAMQGRGRDW